jgi:hypothetical protein
VWKKFTEKASRQSIQLNRMIERMCGSCLLLLHSLRKMDCKHHANNRKDNGAEQCAGQACEQIERRRKRDETTGCIRVKEQLYDPQKALALKA